MTISAEMLQMENFSPKNHLKASNEVALHWKCIILMNVQMNEKSQFIQNHN